MAESQNRIADSQNRRAVAARLHSHGDRLVLEEVTLPEPKAGEVLVDVVYAGVNPVDRYMALGRVAPDGALPRTLGSEGVGTVRSAGQHGAGAGAQSSGRPVVIRGGGLGSTRDGLWATAAVVPQRSLIEIPEGVSPEAASSIGVAGVTSWRAVTETAGVTASDRVLVLGASGGVGSVIVSFVHHLGAQVWGQTGSEAKADFIRGQGADRVVIAGAGDLVEAVAELKPTVVFDPLGGAFTGAAIQALQLKGRLVLFGTSAGTEGEMPLQPLYRKNLKVLGYAGLASTEEELQTGAVGALNAIAKGQMHIPVDRKLPLAKINEAFDLLVDRKVRGNILIDPSGTG